MADSILFTERGKCFLCEADCATEEHHIFGGALRKKSGRLGLVVHLCHACHNEPPNGVHHNAGAMLYVKRCGQAAAMQQYGWSKDDFMREFYKNYL